MTNKTIRSLKYIINRFFFRKRYLVAVAENGLRLRFKTEDVVGRHIYKRGVYEEALSDFISNRVSFEAGDVALDIGANIGWYSLLLGKKLPEGCRVYAFEPDPLNYELLLNNIELNGLVNIVPVNCALSDKTETRKLYRYSSKNLGRHSLLDINEGEYVEVQARTLDDYLAEQDVPVARVKLVKIDVEGYEYFALSGGQRVLDQVDFLISEFVPAHMRKGGVEPAALIDLLVGKGMKAHVIEKDKPVPVTKDQLLAVTACDIVWIRAALIDSEMPEKKY